MTVDEIEELIRKYLSTGIAVVVILVAPGTGNDPALPDRPEVVTVQPGESGDTVPRTTDPPTCQTDRADTPGSDNTGSTDDSDGTGSTGSTGSTDDSGSTGSGSTDGGSSGNGDADEQGSAGDGSDDGEPDNGAQDGTAQDGTSDAAAPDDAAPSDTSPDNADPDDSSSSGDASRDSGRDDPDIAPPPSDRTGAGGTDPGDESAGDSLDADPRRTDDCGDQDSGTTPAPPGNRSGGESGSGESADSGSASTGSGTTAAERHGWGSPNREDDFSGGADQWNIYEGPGHAGKGTRSPSAVSIDKGILTITGDSSGTTAGMAWNPGQKYGRWEGRVKAPASDESYNALLLLWPDAENFPVGGEIDFMEMMDHTRQKTNLFLHYGPSNSQVSGSVEVDATKWHNWALEWTPDAITAFVDGKEWYRTTDKSTFPPGPMHLCIQLDWFPKGGGAPKESTMMVDWVRQYSLDGSGSASGGTGDRSGSDAPTSSDTTSSDDNGSGEGGTPARDAVRRMFSLW